MDDDRPLSFDEHRRLRDETQVRCAHCRHWILATAIRCDHCGVHFQGEAQDFADPAARHRAGKRSLFMVIVALSLVAAIVAALVLRG